LLRRDEHTFGRSCGVVASIPKTGHALFDPDTSFQLGLQDIAFIEEQNDLGLGKQFTLANRFPQQVAVLKTVDTPIFCKLFIKAGDRSQEYDGIDVIEIRHPGMTLWRQVVKPKSFSHTGPGKQRRTDDRVPPTSYMCHSWPILRPLEDKINRVREIRVLWVMEKMSP
jgi:hypothetical protein